MQFLRPVTRRGFRATRATSDWLPQMPGYVSGESNPFLKSIRNAHLAMCTGLDGRLAAEVATNEASIDGVYKGGEEPMMCESFLYADRWCVAVDLGVERRSHPPQPSQEAQEVRGDAPPSFTAGFGGNTNESAAGGVSGFAQQSLPPMFRRITSSPMQVTVRGTPLCLALS